MRELFLGLGVFALAGASAAETLTYIYDASGRLVQVSRTGGASDGVSDYYQYDLANNRVRKSVGTAPPANLPPVAGDDFKTVLVPPSTQTFDVIGNDSDPDGDALIVTGVTGSSVASVYGSGSIKFTNLLPERTYQVTYTISDGRGGTDTAVLTVQTSSDLCEIPAAQGGARSAPDGSNAMQMPPPGC